MYKNFAENKFEDFKDLEHYIEKIDSNNFKGDLFEVFSYFYFLYFKDLYNIEEVFCPVATGKPFPIEITAKLKLETDDHGVDGVYRTTNQELVAYQVKFRSGRARPTERELSTFWSEAEYADYRLIFSNSESLPQVASKKKNHLHIISDSLENLEKNFFKALYEFSNGLSYTRGKKTPRKYQEEILGSIVDGFSESSRGKLIAACGAGKTLLSLWVAENLNSKTVLFLAPSLALIRQTLGSWVENRSDDFSFLCVCSDSTVVSGIEDDFLVEENEIDIPVSTEVDSIVNFLECPSERRYIFSTYQSIDVVMKALKIANATIDLTIYDEAHRTVGSQGNSVFSSSLLDENLSSSKRLFMTATERILKARIKKHLAENDFEVFSMDDENTYGKVFYRLTFGEAISKGIIADYKVVLLGTSDDELKRDVKKSRFIVSDNDLLTDADTLAKGFLLKKSVEELGVSKIITFHSTTAMANRFATLLSEILPDDFYVEHVNGSMSSGKRANLLSNFESSGKSVLTNARCLTEGVDVPLIDSVLFASHKNSVVDIVQAVGRTLRKPYGTNDKTAYILIPIVLDEETMSIESERFEVFFNTLQALRDQDERLAEWINHLNLSLVSGKKTNTCKNSKISILLPKDIDMAAFDEKLSLHIAEYVKNPKDYVGGAGKLGKTERVSTYKRFFKTLGDYNPGPYNESLVQPTLSLINQNEEKKRAELKVNNNNVSHCERMGAIQQSNKGVFKLTSKGIGLKEKIVAFNDLFKNQMLLFEHVDKTGTIFPYRFALRVLLNVKNLNYIEFLFGIYSVQPQSFTNKTALQDVVSIINLIRKEVPNIESVSASNREKVQAFLNSLHPIGFSDKDIWTDRTTTGNQYRFFMRHIELFEDVFDTGNKKVKFIDGGEDKLQEYLEISSPLLDKVNCYSDLWWLK